MFRMLQNCLLNIIYMITGITEIYAQKKVFIKARLCYFNEVTNRSFHNKISLAYFFSTFLSKLFIAKRLLILNQI